MRPKCIYELIDVLELFQKMLYNKSENFRCNFCSELVFLNGFYRDITLEEAVNNIWLRFNKEKLLVKSVIFYRDGFYEPHLSEQEKKKLQKKGKFYSRYKELS